MSFFSRLSASPASVCSMGLLSSSTGWDVEPDRICFFTFFSSRSKSLSFLDEGHPAKSLSLSSEFSSFLANFRDVFRDFSEILLGTAGTSVFVGLRAALPPANCCSAKGLLLGFVVSSWLVEARLPACLCRADCPASDCDCRSLPSPGFPATSDLACLPGGFVSCTLLGWTATDGSLRHVSSLQTASASDATSVLCTTTACSATSEAAGTRAARGCTALSSAIGDEVSALAFGFTRGQASS
mmetsp:Transcript_74622/g.187896  ORF Transcript_74622/g.187896 Transcript_74622/m.187896 type:complete len:241 (+) Transcript_74622:388-1110(+)